MFDSRKALIKTTNEIESIIRFLPGSAFDVLTFPILAKTPVGVPSLDEMSGDWLPMRDVANPPDGREILTDPRKPRPFTGKLLNVSFSGERLTISAGRSGVSEKRTD